MGGVLKIGGVPYPADAVEGNKLLSSTAYLSDSLVAESLGVDSIVATVHDVSTGTPPLDERVKYGEVLEYAQDGKDVLKIYVESVERTGRNSFQVFGISAVGFLLSSDHYGGVYDGESAAQVIADIVGDIFPYQMDEILGETPLYGWLPKQSRRDALRDVLFAIGGQVRKDAAGAVVIAGQAATEPYRIPLDDFYMGGSVTGSNPATGVDLTEHTFMKAPSDATVTLFDGDAAAEQMVTPKGQSVVGVLIDFGEPMHDLQVENAEILESGANYAVISSSPAAVLTGQSYTHTKRIVSRRTERSGVPNIITSHACTLVNLMNSELVADRLMAYYGAAKTVRANLVLSNQKPGDAVVFTDPFGDTREGYIADMALTMSGIIAANTTIVSGFIPTASGNYYSRLVVLTGSGQWTVPEECKGKARIVLIAAGDGGDAGENGEDGGPGVLDFPGIGEYAAYGAPGKGGKPGKGGAPGKVFVGTVPMVPGDVIDYSAGLGGLGGTPGVDAGAGGVGGETTFGKWSSANGFRPQAGYVALISNAVYAIAGEDGVAGGDAPELAYEPTEVTFRGETWISGEMGQQKYWNWDDLTGLTAHGGKPGGPAVGGNGENGQDGQLSIPVSGYIVLTGGRGGAGFSPEKRVMSIVPGSGGYGGHGGGGGGGGAPAQTVGGDPATAYGLEPGQGGPGGLGGPGGNGARGAILSYF